MSVLRQQLAPHLDVTVLHPSQLEVDICLDPVSFGPGQLPVQEGRVGLILEVVQPEMGG
jgi:hypothetical protein